MTQAATAPRALAIDEGPPLMLVGSYFAVAMLGLGSAAFALMCATPALARGAFYDPAVIATTHLFTLGFIVPSVLGALCQFLPVAVGVPLRSRVTAIASLVLVAGGLAAFEVGLWSGAAADARLGGASAALGLFAFAINLAATLARARQRTLTWWALAGATLYLLVTLAWGATLAINLNSGFVSDRFRAVFVHAHVALFGWVGLTIVGVSLHLQPMFLLTHGVSRRWAAAAVALLFAGAALMALPLGARADALGFLLVLAGMGACLVQSFQHYRHRRKRNLDPGLTLAGLALGVLALAIIAGPFAAYAGLAHPRWVTGYVLLAVGAIVLFIAGHYFKIVPFLVWYHRFGPLLGRRHVPKVAELYSAGWARLAGAALLFGVLGTAVSVLSGSASAARASAALFAIGVALLCAQMFRIARRRPA